MYKAKPSNNLNLLKDQQAGALSGEGANFFVLSGQKTNESYASISGLETFYKPENEKVVEDKVNTFLQKNRLSTNDIDLVILGYNGNPAFDDIYSFLEDKLFSENATAYFKHLSGEYDTAVAFATWLASKILKTGIVPPISQKRKYTAKAPEKVLIYNHVRNIHHSLILLEKV
jgi:3-oxoacyl-(acyl-carrier-protein) synthase